LRDGRLLDGKYKSELDIQLNEWQVGTELLINRPKSKKSHSKLELFRNVLQWLL
jgi:hypothetical protein